MSWYSTGTVSVTNGSATITGTGTAWFGTLQEGWGFVGPDGRVYEILSVSDNATLTLAAAYQGSTAAGQGYALFPTKSMEGDLVASLTALLSSYQSVYDGTGQGRFGSGTLALPGVRGVADADTGIAWLASNVLSLVSGGVTQLALGAGAASGAAVQSDALDAGLGKLMTVGAFGLGDKAPELTDLDVLDASIAPGFYHADGPTAIGVPVASGRYHIHHSRRASGGGEVQIATREIYNDVYVRSRSTGSWNDWDLLYSNANILGTVTEVAGVPTGAIIESGSNANGEYTKYANGTLICLGRQFGTASAAATVWTYPHAFDTSPAVVPCCTSGATLRLMTTGSRGPTTVDIHSFDPAGLDTVSPAGDLIAIGNWYN